MELVDIIPTVIIPIVLLLGTMVIELSILIGCVNKLINQIKK